MISFTLQIKLSLFPDASCRHVFQQGISRICARYHVFPFVMFVNTGCQDNVLHTNRGTEMLRYSMAVVGKDK